MQVNVVNSEAATIKMEVNRILIFHASVASFESSSLVHKFAHSKENVLNSGGQDRFKRR